MYTVATPSVHTPVKLTSNMAESLVFFLCVTAENHVIGWCDMAA